EMEARVRNIAIGIVIGAILAVIFGFKVAGWTSTKAAQTQVEEAILRTQSAICTAQFLKQTNTEGRLKEFGRISSGDRADFIEKGGWDKMPGQEQASYGVSRA